jgi:hypothetical protein
MSWNRCWMSLAVVALAGAWVRGGPFTGKVAPPKNPLALLGNGSPDALAGNLRGYLIEALPDPLFEDTRHWGKQEWVTRGIVWRGKGLRIHPERQRQLKNHGHWWKVRVTADRPQDHLVVDIRDVSKPEPGVIHFTVFLSFDACVHYDRQNWRHGLRLYSGGMRARMRVKLALNCEAVAKLDTKEKWNPEVVFRLRVMRAHLHYDNFVVEHIAGVGGELARLLGAAAHAGVQQWKPSLERNLLSRGNAAIVKAGDTKEVRLTLLELLGKD